MSAKACEAVPQRPGFLTQRAAGEYALGRRIPLPGLPTLEARIACALLVRPHLADPTSVSGSPVEPAVVVKWVSAWKMARHLKVAPPLEDRAHFRPDLGAGWFAVLLTLSDVLDRHMHAAPELSRPRWRRRTWRQPCLEDHLRARALVSPLRTPNRVELLPAPVCRRALQPEAQPGRWSSLSRS